MKKWLTAAALGAVLTQGSLVTGAFAQSPTPGAPPPGTTAQPPAAGKMEDAIRSLKLAPKQKMQVVRVLTNARDTNQDQATTVKQLEGVLTPDQMTQLKQALGAPGQPAKP